MSNVSTIYQLKAERSYQRDGYQDLVNALNQVARQEVYSDLLTSTRAAGGAKADIVTNAAVRVYAIQCAMPSTSTTSSLASRGRCTGRVAAFMPGLLRRWAPAWQSTR